MGKAAPRHRRVGARRRGQGPPSAVWVSRNGASLYASGPQGAALTADGGKTWQAVDLSPRATLVEADPIDPNVLYAGVHNGEAVELWVSRDGGRRWARP